MKRAGDKQHGSETNSGAKHWEIPLGRQLN